MIFELSKSGARTEPEISAEIERIAAGLHAMSGRNSLSLSLDALAPFEAQGREIFLDVLRNPTFPAEIFERERGVLLRQIESKKDNPAQIAISLFCKKMFGNHPYGRETWGASDEIEKIKSAGGKSWWLEKFLNGRKHFVVAGATDLSKWINSIEELCLSYKSRSAENHKIELVYPSSEIKAYEKSEKEQSHLVVGFPGLKMRDDDRYVLQIIQSVLAGQGGRLFIELRDKQSLAYSVSPLKMEGLEGGYFGAYIGCAPDKVSLATSMLFAEFRKLCDTRVPDTELSRAQRYIVGRQDIDLQRTSTTASSILFSDLYGIDYNEPFTCAEKYWQVTAKDVERVAKKVFSHPPVMALVGPRSFE